MIKVYTDGASRGNPGKGGWGIVGYHLGEAIFELGGSKSNVTNNQMELTATIESLNYIINNTEVFSKFGKDVEIYTDSQYVVKGMNEWRSGWIRNNWKNSQKKEVMNKELWQKLILLDDGLHKIGVRHMYKYVKGHSGDVGNERADELATMCADASGSHIFSVI